MAENRTGHVRGSSGWRHARNQRKVINRDEGGWGTVTSSGTHYVICAWSDCMNDATELYKVRAKTHTESYEERIMNYVFCSERCKQHWLDDLQVARRNSER